MLSTCFTVLGLSPAATLRLSTVLTCSRVSAGKASCPSSGSQCRRNAWAYCSAVPGFKHISTYPFENDESRATRQTTQDLRGLLLIVNETFSRNVAFNGRSDARS